MRDPYLSRLRRLDEKAQCMSHRFLLWCGRTSFAYLAGDGDLGWDFEMRGWGWVPVAFPGVGWGHWERSISFGSAVPVLFYV